MMIKEIKEIAGDNCCNLISVGSFSNGGTIHYYAMVQVGTISFKTGYPYFDKEVINLEITKEVFNSIEKIYKTRGKQDE